MNNISEIAQKIMELKHIENSASAERRDLESQLISIYKVPENSETTHTFDTDKFYKIKIVCKMNNKVDGDILQKLANENELSNVLSTLFRWTPAIDTRAWKATDKSITDILLGAITTTPAKPSITIIKTI